MDFATWLEKIYSSKLAAVRVIKRNGRKASLREDGANKMLVYIKMLGIFRGLSKALRLVLIIQEQIEL